MKTHTDISKARQEHRNNGGVLLQIGDNPPEYQVVDFRVAVDMRHDAEGGRYKAAAYWAAVGACDFDETKKFGQQDAPALCLWIVDNPEAIR